MRTISSTVFASLVLLLIRPSVAESQSHEPSSLTGSFQLGFRTVDIRGREEKYLEDVGLEDGPRLFHLDLEYVADQGSNRFADRVQLDLQNLGGDPFETFRLSIRKFGHYELTYDRRKSTYFYDDILPPPSDSDSPMRDYHTYDFERVQDTAALDIQLTKSAKLNFGFERYTKNGDSTTSLYIARDGFELESPIDESLTDYVAGFEYGWRRVTVILEERYRDYKNIVEVFLPEASAGSNPTTSTQLDFFLLNQPYDFSSYDHNLKVVARPTQKLQVRFAGSLQQLEMDLTGDEQPHGLDFNGDPFVTNLAGSGQIDRDVDLLDLDLVYRVNPSWALLLSTARRSLDQSGTFVWDEDLKAGRWDIETDTYELGGEFSPSSVLTLSGGVRTESRNLETAWLDDGLFVDDQLTTDHKALWLVAGWHPAKKLDLSVQLEDASYDTPYTDISPTDRQRFRVQLRYRQPRGLWASASALLNKASNSESGWDSSYDQFDLRLGYRSDSLDAMLGYNKTDIGRRIDQTVVAGSGTFPFPVLYSADADFLDGRVRWTGNSRIHLGGSFRLYDNSGTFGVERTDLRGWIEIPFLHSYLLHLGLRSLDYDEKGFDLDDYDATIAEVSIGYQW